MANSKQNVFYAEIKERMQQVLDMCREHKIPVFCIFALDAKQGEDGNWATQICSMTHMGYTHQEIEALIERMGSKPYDELTHDDKIMIGRMYDVQEHRILCNKDGVVVSQQVARLGKQLEGLARQLDMDKQISGVLPGVLLDALKQTAATCECESCRTARDEQQAEVLRHSHGAKIPQA